MKTAKVTARVYCYLSLTGILDVRDFYRRTGIDVRACVRRETDTQTVTPEVRRVYAQTMGLSLDEFDQPISTFVSTLKAKLEANHD